MTETNVGSQNSDGAGENTNSSVSQENKQPVADAASLAKLVNDAVENAIKPIKGEIGGLYSRQDKDRNQIRELMDEVKRQQAKGLSENEALDAAQAVFNQREQAEEDRRMLREVHNRLFATSSAGNGAETDAQRIAKEYALDLNDKDIAEAVKSNDILRLTKTVLSKQSAPSADASDAPLASGKVANPKDSKQLTEEYITKMRESRGNRSAIAALKKEYKEKGVDIYSIDFT